MTKKKKTPTKHSAVARDLRTPKYRMKVAKDKTKYSRKSHVTITLSMDEICDTSKDLKGLIMRRVAEEWRK